jgi:hypothetical protein
MMPALLGPSGPHRALVRLYSSRAQYDCYA